MADVDPQTALYRALAAAQSEFPTVTKNKTATIKSAKGTFKYQYADLGDVLTAIRSVLAKHGLAITQPLRHDPSGAVLETVLLHADGATIESAVAVGQSSSDPQAFGSALTYLRRYALTALLGIAAEEDTDAQHVPKPAAVKPAAPPKLIDQARAEALIARANELEGVLGKLPLAAAHVRGGEPIAGFDSPDEAVAALRVLTVEQAEKLEAWVESKDTQEAMPV